MKRKGWGLVLGASALALGCQTFLDLTPSASDRQEGPDASAVDANVAEGGSDVASSAPDAAIADAPNESCAHMFCDDFEDVVSPLTDRWQLHTTLGKIEPGAGNHGSRGLRCRSSAVADAASVANDRRAYVSKTFNLDGGAQTIRAKMALDCAKRLVGNQYVLVLGVRIHDPTTNQDTAEAFFARTTSDGVHEKARLLISGVDLATGFDVEKVDLPSQWIDVALELRLNAGAWTADASAGTVSATWTEYSPNVLVHSANDKDLTAIHTRDGGQVVEVQMGIEYLTEGSGDAVDIGIDDVEIDIE